MPVEKDRVFFVMNKEYFEVSDFLTIHNDSIFHSILAECAEELLKTGKISKHRAAKIKGHYSIWPEDDNGERHRFDLYRGQKPKGAIHHDKNLFQLFVPVTIKCSRPGEFYIEKVPVLEYLKQKSYDQEAVEAISQVVSTLSNGFNHNLVEWLGSGELIIKLSKVSNKFKDLKCCQ